MFYRNTKLFHLAGWQATAQRDRCICSGLFCSEKLVFKIAYGSSYRPNR